LNYGRRVLYSLELWPTKLNSLGAPTPLTNAIVTEHLSKPMAYGTSSPGKISGQFEDILGNTSGSNGGTYDGYRYFTVNSSGKNLGRIETYDAAGTHIHYNDHIVIHLPNGPTILNGSLDDISIP
jgi:hypothetical protein